MYDIKPKTQRTWKSNGKFFSSNISANVPLILRFSTIKASPVLLKLTSFHVDCLGLPSTFCTTSLGFQYWSNFAVSEL